MKALDQFFDEAGKAIRAQVDALDKLPTVFKAPMFKVASIVACAPHNTVINQWRRKTTLETAKKVLGSHIPSYKAPHSFGHTMVLDASARLFPGSAFGVANALAGAYLPEDKAVWATAPAGILSSALGVPPTNWAQGKPAFAGVKAAMASEAAYGAGFTSLYAPARSAAGFKPERQYGDALAAGFVGGIGASLTSWIPHGWAQSKQLLSDVWSKIPLKDKLTIAAKSAPAARVLTCVPACMSTAAMVESVRELRSASI